MGSLSVKQAVVSGRRSRLTSTTRPNRCAPQLRTSQVLPTCRVPRSTNGLRLDLSTQAFRSTDRVRNMMDDKRQGTFSNRRVMASPMKLCVICIHPFSSDNDLQTENRCTLVPLGQPRETHGESRGFLVNWRMVSESAHFSRILPRFPLRPVLRFEALRSGTKPNTPSESRIL